MMMMNNKNYKLAKVVLMLVSAAVAAASAGSVDEALWKAFEEHEAQEERVVPMVMHKLPDECGAEAHLPIRAGSASLLQGQNVPGAGVDGIAKFQPFKRVMKDGFFLIECTKDYMYYRGDKFGDNKHDYKLGFVNVSIVHFDAFIAKKDQKEMTPRKCFEFCRTVPNMGFFGLVNGRSCYCTPYYTPMESDDSQCDAACEGDTTLTCGGKSKSSIFAMHMCDSTKDDLGDRTAEAKQLMQLMKKQGANGAGLARDMQRMGVALQKTFGMVGDSSATGLAQDAKVFAGTLLHKSEDVIAAARKLEDLTSSSSKLASKHFGNSSKKNTHAMRFASSNTIEAAESLMDQIEESVASNSALVQELHTLRSLAVGRVVSDDECEESERLHGSLSGYVWTEQAADELIMEEDHKLESMPQSMKARFVTSTHYDWQHKKEYTSSYWSPKANAEVTPDELAWWKHTEFCLIFLYFLHMAGYVTMKPPPPEIFKEGYYPVMHFVDKAFEKVPATCSGSRVAKPIVGASEDMCALACDTNIHSCVGFQYFSGNGKSLCFLLSDFETGFYYTGCGKSFLQAEASSFDARCYAKLSKFEGTTLKPNPSGKCPRCFKKLTKADRCYK